MISYPQQLAFLLVGFSVGTFPRVQGDMGILTSKEMGKRRRFSHRGFVGVPFTAMTPGVPSRSQWSQSVEIMMIKMTYENDEAWNSDFTPIFCSRKKYLSLILFTLWPSRLILKCTEHIWNQAKLLNQLQVQLQERMRLKHTDSEKWARRSGRCDMDETETRTLQQQHMPNNHVLQDKVILNQHHLVREQPVLFLPPPKVLWRTKEHLWYLRLLWDCDRWWFKWLHRSFPQRCKQTFLKQLQVLNQSEQREKPNLRVSHFHFQGWKSHGTIAPAGSSWSVDSRTLEDPRWLWQSVGNLRLDQMPSE